MAFSRWCAGWRDKRNDVVVFLVDGCGSYGNVSCYVRACVYFLIQGGISRDNMIVAQSPVKPFSYR